MNDKSLNAEVLLQLINNLIFIFAFKVLHIDIHIGIGDCLVNVSCLS